MNTYISINILVYRNKPDWNTGHIFTSNKAAKLELHLDVPYEQAKKELAKLMARTGELPHVVGKDDPTTESVMYILSAFLD